ncbi:MAG: hypothetical protein JOY72_03665 [Actinobacteria bacterium]|nr:hypothetical protein [Actinomycetota bacterium]
MEPEQGSTAGGPNSEAAAAADLRAYYERKRSMVVWSVVVAVPASLVVATRSPVAAAALGFGAICGIANALLSMRSGERLVDHRSVGFFVFSSVLRIFVFAIVPVGFARAGPWWSLVTYFFGFFMPLAINAVSVGRAVRTS